MITKLEENHKIQFKNWKKSKFLSFIPKELRKSNLTAIIPKLEENYEFLRKSN